MGGFYQCAIGRNRFVGDAGGPPRMPQGGQWVGSADCARCWLAVLVAYSIVFACT